ncbi:MAG: AAA family ATPase, partial [Anaerolineales bacterium]|nr:AAA family ATPase [Anaerolineales bacterium]
GKRDQRQPLPWTRLRVGAPVLLWEERPGAAPEAGWRGVVSRLERETIQVAFPNWPEPEAERPLFRLDHAHDEVARQRQRQALEAARGAPAGRLGRLREVLLGRQPAQFRAPEDVPPLAADLNASQIEAVRFALTAEDVAILHGPPGTGKTTTLVELIRQITRRGQTVLACAPSNLAVDNLLERLLAWGEPALRLGHPARVLPALREHTLDLLVENHPEMDLARRLTREAHALRDRAGKFRRARPAPGERQAQRQEAREMLAEARRIEGQLVDRLLDGARIICATTTGLERELLSRRVFDWCVLDEASQSTEPGAWVPLLYAQRLVLAGDHCQLPPTVISPEAAAAGFNVSLMERLLAQLGPDLARRLAVQYRMHADIMGFSAREFYADGLSAAPAVRAHRLCDLPGVAAAPLTETPAEFIDTAGAGYDEAAEPDGDSRYNPAEAEVVLERVRALLAAGLPAADIAVITPYAAQARWLRAALGRPEVEIDTVDGFQGREQEAVLVSLVRSNREGEIGFLGDVRRMNVALTRARRKLIVVGDSATIAAHPFYQRLVAYFEALGAYRSVWEAAAG